MEAGAARQVDRELGASRARVVRRRQGYQADRYDCSPADNRRWKKAQAHTDQDEKYEYVYPLRLWGWTREDCIERIERAGLPVPPKSACFMCPATKPQELHELPAALLRQIVLMEARAKPRLTNIDGLWRKPVKGVRKGSTARPGSMTEYIRDQGLLPAAEVAAIISAAPAALLAFQAEAATKPLAERPELAEWLRMFELRDSGALDCAGTPKLYADIDQDQVRACEAVPC